MNGTGSGYGSRGLVIVNSLVFMICAFSFFKPATKRNSRTFGGFSAFVVALFAEMYGPTRRSGTPSTSHSSLSCSGFCFNGPPSLHWRCSLYLPSCT